MIAYELASYSLERMKFPLIVKPIDCSGSRGVTKVSDLESVREAVIIACNESFEKKAIVEEYVLGKEYSIEGMSYKGKHTILAYTEKFTTGEPHFIETGHMEPANLEPEIKEKVDSIICHALTSLGIENGASHSEIKIDTNGEIKIIEIGARMGGDLIGSDLVMLSTGIDYLKAVIDISMGDIPDLRPVSNYIGMYMVKYILNKSDIEDYEKMKMESPERIKKTIGYYPEKLKDVKDSSGRSAGVYIYRL